MTERGLLSEDRVPRMKGSVVSVTREREAGDRSRRVELSALWAAYGDAVGWISELTDESGLKRRTGGRRLVGPLEWRRRIGGRFGVPVLLPKGCYSDDTQLRLATGRAIRSDGFDVEAFARVELPVWLSYGLGGGRGTMAAAERLARPRSTWWANSFRGWTNSGGNGAAMRVQPHVWAAEDLSDPMAYLQDVVRNAVCTHSHPRGVMGAVLHSLCVAHAMRKGTAPTAVDVSAAIRVGEQVPELVDSDSELRLWQASYEQAAGDFRKAWDEVLGEARGALDAAVRLELSGTGGEGYEKLVETLRLREPACRGSGLLTVLAATALAWCEGRVKEAVSIAANALGTDTDTIATMAGAVLGATSKTEPPCVLDSGLFRAEARRLSDIAGGRSGSSHVYPDLLHWQAPQTRADALVRSEDGRLAVRGLGLVGEADCIDGSPPVRQGNFGWRWVRLDLGQTLLVKHRDSIPKDPGVHFAPGPRARPRIGTAGQPRPREKVARPAGPSGRGKYSESGPPGGSTRGDRGDRVPGVVAYVAGRIGDDKVIGSALRRVVRDGSTGEIAGFVAALVELLRRQSGSSTVLREGRGEELLAEPSELGRQRALIGSVDGEE